MTTETPKPQAGTWTLTAPDGRKWTADSPLRVVAQESRERIPASVALERVLTAAAETPDPCYIALKKIVRTPAMPFPDPGEKLDVQLIPLLPMPTPNDRRALLNQIAAMDAGQM